MAKKNSLLDLVKARTEANVVKSRSGSGRTTYLDRFIDVLTDDEGNPTEGKDRVEIITEMSVQILEETLKANDQEEAFVLTETKDGEFDIMLANINRKVKAQVAAAIANNNNSTSISYNEATKDKWEVVQEGKMISLLAKAQD